MLGYHVVCDRQQKLLKLADERLKREKLDVLETELDLHIKEQD